MLGATGSGKSLLLEALVGKLPLVAGKRVVGERWLQMLHWDQSARAACDLEDETPVDFVTRLTGGGADDDAILSLLDGVGVDRFAARRPVGCLSSGERTMTALCALGAAPKHLLVLDEPMAFLGTAAVETIAAALSPERWPGAILYTASSRAAAEALKPTHLAVVAGGRVTVHDRPPEPEDWDELEKDEEAVAGAGSVAAEALKPDEVADPGLDDEGTPSTKRKRDS